MVWLWCIPAVLLIILLGLFFHLHRFLVLEQPPQQVDAIVVLSGGDPKREEEAAKLYKAGYSDRIILTRAPAGWQTYTSDMMREHLIDLGVPADSIIDYGIVTSTREEAILLRPLIDELSLRSLIVVTNKFHSARALWIFKRVLKDENIKWISVPVREDIFDHQWWRHHHTRKQAASEILKTLWEIMKL